MRVHDTQQAEIFNLLSQEEREAPLRIIVSSKIELSWRES